MISQHRDCRAESSAEARFIVQNGLIGVSGYLFRFVRMAVVMIRASASLSPAGHDIAAS